MTTGLQFLRCHHPASSSSSPTTTTTATTHCGDRGFRRDRDRRPTHTVRRSWNPGLPSATQHRGKGREVVRCLFDGNNQPRFDLGEGRGELDSHDGVGRLFQTGMDDLDGRHQLAAHLVQLRLLLQHEEELLFGDARLLRRLALGSHGLLHLGHLSTHPLFPRLRSRQLLHLGLERVLDLLAKPNKLFLGRQQLHLRLRPSLRHELQLGLHRQRRISTLLSFLILPVVIL